MKNQNYFKQQFLQKYSKDKIEISIKIGEKKAKASIMGSQLLEAQKVGIDSLQETFNALIAEIIIEELQLQDEEKIQYYSL